MNTTVRMETHCKEGKNVRFSAEKYGKIWLSLANKKETPVLCKNVNRTKDILHFWNLHLHLNKYFQ